MDLIVAIGGLAALAYAAILASSVLRLPAGTKEMQAISNAIKEGSVAYLKRQYRTVAMFSLLIFIPLLFLLNWQTAFGFLLGVFLSALAGYIGMMVSVRANVRVAAAAKGGLEKAFMAAFRGGAVTGFAVVGLGLLGVSALYALFGNVMLVVGFGFGASLMSLFARVGGGIYTKAADVGADLVGKVEKGIPEDDPRNPAVIADNIGDNIGDCAGMAADLFESYAVTLIAAMLLGLIIGSSAVLFPLAMGAAGIIASIIGTFFVRLGKSKNIWNALYKGVIATTIVSAMLFYLISNFLFQSLNIFYAALVGLGATLAISYITEFYTARDRKAVIEVAEASKTGAATTIISGLALGMRSTVPITMLIATAIFAAFYFGGIYGVVVAALGMLSVTGIIVALDSYGPITDNAGGIAEMSKLPPKVRKVTDALDAVGNTTKAVTKGFAIGSAALAALSLFVAYAHDAGLKVIDILNVNVVVGLFIGGVIPFIFSSLLIGAVGKTAFSVVEEVRMQFKTIKGLMQGKAKPNYERCVDITTKAALKELITPGIIAVGSPLFVGFLFGAEALGGMLAGSIVSGLMLAITQTTAGAAWDNAKKYIEAGNFGGKGSPAHAASVVGDTVGDPLKDTSGVSINPLLKVLNMVALLFASLIVAYSVL